MKAPAGCHGEHHPTQFLPLDITRCLTESKCRIYKSSYYYLEPREVEIETKLSGWYFLKWSMKPEHAGLFLLHYLTFPFMEHKLNTAPGQDKSIKDHIFCWVSASTWEVIFARNKCWQFDLLWDSLKTLLAQLLLWILALRMINVYQKRSN